MRDGDGSDGGGQAREALTALFDREPTSTSSRCGLPARIGPYRIIEELGRGGMGIVYKAFQESLNREVALKVLTTSELAGETAVRRFVREAEAVAHLQHPNIVPILELGEHASQPYFTMAYIEGPTLQQALRAGSLTRIEAVAAIERVAAAVSHAHAHGVIHRDLKPANILLGNDGEPQVTDFGLAIRTGVHSSISATGQIVGTPNYMSPEQADGHGHEADASTDVYGLGATLYHVLTGQPPFAECTQIQALFEVVHRDPKPPRAIDPTIARDLEIICLKAMAKEKQRRYASAEAFRADLERFLHGEAILARPSSLPYRVGKLVRRNWAATAALALLVVVMTLAATYVTLDAARRRTGWTLVLSDDFNRTDVGSSYRVESGSWRIHDAALLGQGVGFVGIDLAQAVRGNFRLELDATVLPGSGKNEIALFVDSSARQNRGYYFGFGGDNEMTAMDRGGAEIRLVVSPAVEVGHTYRIALERHGNLLAMTADGEPLVSYVDPLPLNPAEYAYLRVGTYDGIIRLDNLRIRQESLPELVSAIALGDRLYERSEFAAAQDAYERILLDHPGRPIAGEARFKVGLCLAQQRRYAEALDTFRQVETSAAPAYYKGLARLDVAWTMRLQGRLDEALHWLTTLAKRAGTPDERYQLGVELDLLGAAFWNAGRKGENLEIRRFIVAQLPDLPIAEASALILSNADADHRQHRVNVEQFLARYPRIGKTRRAALQHVAICSLKLGEPSRALSAFETMAAEFAGRNARFVLDGIFGQGLALAFDGRWQEALTCRERMRGVVLGEGLSGRAAIDLEVLVLRLRGEVAEAVRLLENLPAPLGRPFDRVEVALLYHELGDTPRFKEILRAVSERTDGPAGAVALFLRGETPESDFEANPAIDEETKRRFFWEYRVLNGDREGAARSAFLRDEVVLTPALCRAILASGREGQR